MNVILEELKRQLSRRDYRVLKLRAVSKLRHWEIARRVGLSRQAVTKILAKVRRTLRALEARFRAIPA